MQITQIDKQEFIDILFINLVSRFDLPFSSERMKEDFYTYLEFLIDCREEKSTSFILRKIDILGEEIAKFLYKNEYGSPEVFKEFVTLRAEITLFLVVHLGPVFWFD